MRYFKVIVAVLALGLSGCLGSRQPLNPPVLVTARDTDMAIQLFMQANILLARYYGFETIDYETVRDVSVRHGYDTIPFMAPITKRATPGLVQTKLKSNLVKTDDAGLLLKGDAYRQWVDQVGGYKMLVKYYVTTGWRASQIVCRNYLLGLDEKNQYLEFLQKEFSIAFGLANTILALSDANGTLRSAFGVSQTAINDGVNAYQDYRFLPIVDREAARVLIESAQNAYALSFLQQVDNGMVTDGKLLPPAVIPASVPQNATPAQLPGFILFSDAIHAVSTIEYQCTRSGIRNLVSRAVSKAPENIRIQPGTNALIFQ